MKNEGKTASRLYELDLLKALGIVGMILCHCVIRLGLHLPAYEQDLRYLIGDIFFGDYLAVAHAFMFAMGVAVNYSSRNSPRELFLRGVRLYVLGFVLNFLRYGIYALADGLLSGEFASETVYALTVQDILHFAGLALMATGLFRRLKLKEGHILLVGLLLSALGGPLAFVFQGGPAADYFLGHFIVTTEESSCFAFFNWYVFVAAGLLYGAVLRKTEDLDRFYGRLMRVACPVMGIYLVLTAVFGPLFLTKNGWYYAASLPEAAGLLSIDLTLLGAFHFLLKRVGASRFSVFITMSRNLNRIYCVHWCILGFVDSIFCYLLGVVFPWPAIYLFGAALIVLSAWLAERWAGRKRAAKTA
ncbi:MAG: heparan-alpha-glucosaminide N-acetyltransferase domain-containing protein [Oscillospiraceae bacterium]|nr:heparan-alpha-glucosaminide N-acetyltransferase domain-containing protein [Oscillospiraceae bacterium]